MTTKKYRQSEQGKATIHAYNQSSKGKFTIKKYQQSEKGKLVSSRAEKKYRQSEKGKAFRTHWSQSEERKASGRKYRTSQLGKLSQKKYETSEKAKMIAKRVRAMRKRNFNWILMFPNPFADNVNVDYHHITDAYVVAIPKELHQLYGGKSHREKTMEIVKQIYLRGN